MVEIFEMLQVYLHVALERLMPVITWFLLISAIAAIVLFVVSAEARKEAKETITAYFEQARQMLQNIRAMF